MQEDHRTEGQKGVAKGPAGWDVDVVGKPHPQHKTDGKAIRKTMEPDGFVRDW
jgi:hypothetical protein